jgi:alkylation response protein AidB-like acyl-CoA dehydrogenase
MLADLKNEPVLTSCYAWGHRIDQIEVTALWKKAQRLCAEHGMVAAGYENRFGDLDRVHQFALNYMVQASLDIYSCPLAMTDGAVRTLKDAGNQELIDRAVPNLISRDAQKMWTSGQWMTERTGGSDVGTSETVARKDGDQWLLTGTKWFTSATTSDMALTLARPEGNGPGGKGLALFYVELRGDDGRLRGLEVNRLKDKFGTKKVPTAELKLVDTPAVPVTELGNGVRNITPMLSITRTWNSVAAAWAMRRCVALSKDYSRRRRAFGDVLAQKPLHLDTLAGMIAETEAAFHLSFRITELLGKVEHNTATDAEKILHRILTPIAKLLTAKQAVAVASETLECFGGAGYVEDTGLPRILADAQVLPIWEGTTNVLSLDTLRVLAKEPGVFEVLTAEFENLLGSVSDPRLNSAVHNTRTALIHATAWAGKAMAENDLLEAGARRFAMTLGRAYELALLCSHAQWVMDRGNDRALLTARRFSNHGVDLIVDNPLAEARALVDLGS